METPKADRPSEEQMWAGPSGDRWLANAAGLEETMRPVGEALLDRAALAPGEHVLDVGCGAGGVSLAAAARIAPGGSVTGIDISAALVAQAARRAAAANLPVPVRFLAADAARTPLPPAQADCLLSRFGTMFFTDPAAAFTHMHGLLRPGGRIALAVWAPLSENPWMIELRNVVAAHFDLPTPPPRTPGPFAFDEPEYLRGILTAAGFTHIEFSRWQASIPVCGAGSTPQSATDFMISAMSVGQRVLDAPAEVREQVRRDLRDRLTPYNTPAGVQMPASVWFVTAHS
jgi:SAM-dependent methyltransferase